MKRNNEKNRTINEKYFNDPVQNAAFICHIDVLAELIEKYVDRFWGKVSREAGYVLYTDGSIVVLLDYRSIKIVTPERLKGYVRRYKRCHKSD